MKPQDPNIKPLPQDHPLLSTDKDLHWQEQLLHNALRVAAGLPPTLPPIDLFKRERPCRLVA